MVVYWQSKVINVMASGKEVTKIIIMLPVYWFSILKHVSASTKVKLAKYNCFAIFPDFWEYIWWHVTFQNARWYQYIFLSIEIMKGPILLSMSYFTNYFIMRLTRWINQKCLSYIVIACTKDVLKKLEVMYVPQIRDNNPIRGNDEGVPILMSLTVYKWQTSFKNRLQEFRKSLPPAYRLQTE